LRELGETPLPKELERDVEPEDEERYQTIYAKNEGAVAAPVAGLHFSKHLLKRMEIKGIVMTSVTMHIGLGTFSPVEVEDLSKHKMDSEQAFITQETCDIVNEAIDKRRNICAVGTTTMRSLESAVSSNGHLNTFEGWTNKFIFPEYDFSIANSMITNFHHPKSTLMMQAAAFAGYDFLKKAYELAMKEKYRFSTYGDAMLIID
jgi:S-adenosylmethionine:tRNA ribosyltransferase-isomerase